MEDAKMRGAAPALASSSMQSGHHVDDFLALDFSALSLLSPGLVTQRIHGDPPVYCLWNFLSPDECDDLIELSDGRLTTAQVVGMKEQGGRMNAHGYYQGFSPQRTSSVCTLKKYEADFLVRKIEALTQKPRSHFESPQVAQYIDGQSYAAHYDAVSGTTDVGQQFLSAGGQRICTVLVYLNSPEKGGHTRFPNLGLSVQPIKGMALIFFPATVDGDLDPRALHSAEPALDTKFVSQTWIRQFENPGRVSEKSKGRAKR